jgi:hypothetical protein
MRDPGILRVMRVMRLSPGSTSSRALLAKALVDKGIGRLYVGQRDAPARLVAATHLHVEDTRAARNS